MSKKIWGTVLTALILIAAVTLAFWYGNRDAGTPPQEQKGTQLVEVLPTKNIPDKVSMLEGNSETGPGEPAQDAETDAYEFVLVDNDNYVAVYSLPENEIYEYTDVILDVLPEELQEEIRKGKYLKSEEELYNFLENYTS